MGAGGQGKDAPLATPVSLIGIRLRSVLNDTRNDTPSLPPDPAHAHQFWLVLCRLPPCLRLLRFPAAGGGGGDRFVESLPFSLLWVVAGSFIPRR